MIDEIGDLMVYCLGLCKMFGIESEEILITLIDKNKTRNHTGQI